MPIISLPVCTMNLFWFISKLFLPVAIHSNWNESALTNQFKNKYQSLNTYAHVKIDTTNEEKENRKYIWYLFNELNSIDNVRKILKSHLDVDFDISIIRWTDLGDMLAALIDKKRKKKNASEINTFQAKNND